MDTQAIGRGNTPKEQSTLHSDTLTDRVYLVQEFDLQEFGITTELLPQDFFQEVERLLSNQQSRTSLSSSPNTALVLDTDTQQEIGILHAADQSVTFARPTRVEKVEGETALKVHKTYEGYEIWYKTLHSDGKVMYIHINSEGRCCVYGLYGSSELSKREFWTHLSQAINTTEILEQCSSQSLPEALYRELDVLELLREWLNVLGEDEDHFSEVTFGEKVNELVVLGASAELREAIDSHPIIRNSSDPETDDTITARFLETENSEGRGVVVLEIPTSLRLEPSHIKGYFRNVYNEIFRTYFVNFLIQCVLNEDPARLVRALRQRR